MAEYLRAAGFVLAAALYAMCVACFAVYIARFVAAARNGMAGRRKGSADRSEDFDWMGALPAHVWLAALAVNLWQVTLCGLMVYAFTEPVQWWGLPFILAGDVAMLASVIAAVRYEYRLLH